MCRVPSTSRSRTTRSVIRSTVPALPAISTVSPTEIEFSTSMKNPVITSFTRLWAPNETASPRMPAPARIGPMLMNWFSVIRSASAMISRRPRLRSSWATVRPCFSCIVIVLSSPSSTARSMRRARRRTSRSPSQAMTQMATSVSRRRSTTCGSTCSNSAIRLMNSGMGRKGKRSVSAQGGRKRSASRPEVNAGGAFNARMGAHRRGGHPFCLPGNARGSRVRRSHAPDAHDLT